MPPTGAAQSLSSALEDFRQQLKNLTIQPRVLIDGKLVPEGPAFVKAWSLKQWLLTEITEDGVVVTNIERLMDDACTQGRRYRIPQDCERIMRSCPLVFCMLLELRRGYLIYELMSCQIIDDRVVSYSDRELEQRVSRALPTYEQTDISNVTRAISTKRWKYMPHNFDFDPFRQDLSPPTVLPIAKRQPINSKGANAEIHQLCIPAEFLSSELKNRISSSFDDPEFEKCYLLAVKTYKTNPSDGSHDDRRREERIQQLFDGEYEAYHHLSGNHGMVQFLGAFSRHCSDGSIEYNILLEYGDYDLAEYFQIHPPVLPQNVQSFWENLFSIATALAKLHKFVIPCRGREDEYHGWHADIKPDNILIVNGDLKLADPGYAEFAKLIEGQKPPPMRVRAWTVTYAAPEFVVNRQEIAEPQKADMWSLGCVFSVAATWLVLGPPGVIAYTEYRRNAASKDSSNGIDDRFHNGSNVLPEIKHWHDYLRNVLRPTDRIAGVVLSLVEKYLLQTSPENRVTADQLCEALGKTVQKYSDHSSQALPRDLVEAIDKVEERLNSLPAEPRSLSIQARKKRKTRGMLDDPAWGTLHLTDATIETTVREGSTLRVNKSSVASLPFGSESNRHSFNSPPPPTPARLKRASTSRHIAQTVFDMHYTHQDKDKEKGKKLVGRLLGAKDKDATLRENYNNRDIVFIVDNGASMAALWNQVTFVLEKLAKTSAWIDDDGIDLEFTNGSAIYKLKDKSIERDVQRAMRLDNNHPKESNGNGLSPRLREKLLAWHQVFKNTRNKKTVRNLTMIILTDGIWSRSDAGVEKAIRDFVKILGKIDESVLTTRPVSIQFVAFGDDESAIDRMRQLDNCLEGSHDIVDTEMWGSDVYKMLLGSFVPDIDDLDINTEPEETDASSSVVPRETQPQFSAYDYETPTRRERFRPGQDNRSEIPRTSITHDVDRRQMQTPFGSSNEPPRIHRNVSHRESREQNRSYGGG